MIHRPTFLIAEWRNLAVLTYRIDRAALEPHLPRGLMLDTWDDKPLVSLVGFQFLKTRILGMRVPFWGSFPEVNLRFYVRRRTPDGGERRGVVFIKELVPYYPVAAIARGLYNENYHHLPMSYGIAAGTAEYRWQYGGRGHRLAVSGKGLPVLPDDESLDTFIIDHHWGYSQSRSGECIEYEVGRVPWRVFPVGGFEIDVDVKAMYGEQFAEAMSNQPISVVLAEGSRISVSFGRRIA